VQLNPYLLSILFATFFCVNSCQKSGVEKTKDTSNQKAHFDLEKAAILKILNEETKAAFNRDYPTWKEKWVHEKYVTKTYMDFRDTSLSETLGWDDINDFVKTYIEEHPEPSPLPTLVKDIEVRLYGNGAWVNYEQEDPERGRKRETRLMEKINGQWKIAGMQTVIYGFNN